jgi:hypothetical protein
LPLAWPRRRIGLRCEGTVSVQPGQRPLCRPLTRHDSHVAQQMVERAAELVRDSHARTRHAPQAWRQFETTFDGSNISEANEISGSHVGSQRWPMPGDARPRLATVGAAQRHIGLHPAASGDAGGMPPKQEFGWQRAAGRLRWPLVLRPGHRQVGLTAMVSSTGSNPEDEYADYDAEDREQPSEPAGIPDEEPEDDVLEQRQEIPTATTRTTGNVRHLIGPARAERVQA